MGSLRGIGGGVSGIFGDGADGDLFVTGAFTLQRDSFYRNVTLSGAAPSVFTNGFRLFVNATCSFLTNGTVFNDGSSGSFIVPGAPNPSGSLPFGFPGGSGTIVIGLAGSGPGGAYSGGGGAGGSGSQPGGPGGKCFFPTPISGSPESLLPMLVGFTFGQGGPYPIFGGGGGGGGGGPGAIQRGGGGGSGGGVLLVAAHEIRVRTRMTGTFRANGGPGGPGELTSITGGGGGGGGGVVLLTTTKLPRQIGPGYPTGSVYDPVYNAAYVSPWDGAVYLQADGGLGGSPAGGGDPGAAGGSGSIFVLEV